MTLTMTGMSEGRGHPLPPLRADLRLLPTAPDDDGSPMWVLFDPLRNRYFQLDLRGLRVLRHWRTGASPETVAAAAADRGVEVDASEVDGLANFLLANGLTETSKPEDTARLAKQHEQGRSRWYQFVIHRYLFIRIPLVRPDPFLARHIHRVRFLGSRPVRVGILVLGAIGILLALRQWEYFASTFVGFLNWQGVVWYVLALIAVKTIHELAHAFVAHHHGCRVPSMGIAFLVLFPVLYTDATDTWRLSRGRDRLTVALAGVSAEIAIALLATFAWSFLPPGGLRDAAFFVATTSWVTSLLINLTPFMRFDGYHALSDFWGIHNLQPRAFDLARWQLREALFGFGEPAPESFRPRRRRFLVAYAFATWLYRLILFIGIALLIYHLAFKALGVVLFVLEIGWFIGRPILQEIVAMTRRRWRWNRPTARTLLIAGLLLAALFVPWRSTVPLPAVLDAATHARVYPPEAGRVEAVPVSVGDQVESGDVVVRLEKPVLELEAQKALKQQDIIRARLARRAGSGRDLAAEEVLRKRLAEHRIRLEGLRARQAELVVRSPVKGVVKRQADLKVGQWVGREQLLAELVGTAGVDVIAYVREQARWRVKVGAMGVFIPNDGVHEAFDVRVTDVEGVGAERLEHDLLASQYGGPLPVRNGEGRRDLRLAEGIYQVRLEVEGEPDIPDWRVPGRASIQAPAESLAGRFFRYAASVLIRESGF